METYKNTPHWLWAFRFGLRSTPLSAVASILFLIVAALIPAATVVLIKLLSSAMGSEQRAVRLIILVAVVFGAGNAWQQVSNAISRVNAMRINLSSASLFEDRLSQASAREFNDEGFMKELRAARQCVAEGHVSSQFQATVNIACATLTAFTLSLSLWEISTAAALISLLAPIPTTLAYAWYGKQESHLWPQATEEIRRSTYLQDQISYQRTAVEISTLRATNVLAELAAHHRCAHMAIRQRLEWLSIASDSLAGLVTTGLFAIALLTLYRDSGNNIGALFAGTAGVMAGISAMMGIGYQIGELVTSLPANKHLRSFADRPTEQSSPLDVRNAEALIASDVTVNYGTLRAVDHVSLEAPSGKLTAIVGENGSGKTLLLKALMNTQRDASGGVLIGDRTINVGEDEHISFYVSAVLQDYGRYEISVRRFLMLGSRQRAADSQLWDALEFASIAPIFRDSPNGLDTPWEASGAESSCRGVNGSGLPSPARWSWTNTCGS